MPNGFLVLYYFQWFLDADMCIIKKSVGLRCVSGAVKTSGIPDELLQSATKDIKFMFLLNFTAIYYHSSYISISVLASNAPCIVFIFIY